MSRFALLLMAFFLFGCSGGKKTNEILHLAIWENYISPEMLADFKSQTGIEVRTTHYSSNEELLAKVQNGNSGIDVAVPSDYMVSIMSALGLLEKLDHSKITNIKNLLPEVSNLPFDPGNSFSVPYAWTTSGIAFNRKLLKNPPTSWSDFFAHPEYKGRLAMLDDMRESTAAALKKLGYSVNTTKEDELAAAANLLAEQKKRIKLFTSEVITALTNKEVALAQAYSSDALQARAATKGEIEFIIPKEGATQAIDSLVILKGGKNREAAHKFLNFLLEKENNLAFVKVKFGRPVVRGVKELLPPELQKDPALFPPPDTEKNLERIIDLKENNALYEKIWNNLKLI
ncbi:MAG: spermidine/putrescine ABC transporter substrate-binding protein [Bdellovibrionaceae bacterium]|nr:spermidine/putrescine ABC transporter substrate-binding protein [Pseudobdellovibrionaceae bacterium]